MDKEVAQEENCPEPDVEWESNENEEVETANVKDELLDYSNLEEFSFVTDEREGEGEEDPIGSARKRPSQPRNKCKYCSKSLSTPAKLRDHLRVHTGERPYPCDVCEKKFRSKANLAQHKLIHDGIKPYECDECGTKFSQSHSLIRHKTTHSEKRPFKCDSCDYRCKSKSDLTRHFKSRHE